MLNFAKLKDVNNDKVINNKVFMSFS